MLIGNVAAGLWFSPLTVMRQVRVDGIPESLRANVEAILKDSSETPCVRIPARQIESRVQALPGIRTAEFRRNVFGVATLQVTKMVPVATVEGEKGLYLSDRGELFRSQEVPGPIPNVSPPEGFARPVATLAAPWESRDAARACSLASKHGFIEGPGKQQPTLQFESGGGIVMQCPQGARVELGSADQLEEKFAKLKELRARNPKLLAENSTINVVSPSRASIVPIIGH